MEIVAAAWNAGELIGGDSSVLSGRERATGYHFARWRSITPSPLASRTPPGNVPLNVPNGAV